MDAIDLIEIVRAVAELLTNRNGSSVERLP